MDRTNHFDPYIDRTFACTCGHMHTCTVKRIVIESGAVKSLPVIIRDLGFHKPFLVADRNTWTAAGVSVSRELEASGIPYGCIILDYEEVVPDEAVIGEIMTAFSMDCDLVLGIGSGTINDLCKFVSHRLGREYILAASAPSMDGFVSTGAALMLRHVKTTIDCHGPAALVCDVDILASAPMRLILAGLGDTLGKYTCLLDWKLSHMINGEYYCKDSAALVDAALKTVREQSKEILLRDQGAVKAVTEALVLTGIAMSYVGNSRPASGCEHHLSHFWEMKTLMEGKTPALHGEQVGVGMLLALELYHDLAKEEPDFAAAASRPFDPEEWSAGIRKTYADASEGIIRLEEKTGKNDVVRRNARLSRMKDFWPEICRTIEESLPSVKELEDLLRSLGAPVSPQDIGISAELAAEGVLFAKEVRDRYTLLQLLWDLGLSEKYAAAAENCFTRRSEE